MSRIIGPKRSLIQSTGRADLGVLVASLAPVLKASTVVVPAKAVFADVRALGSGGATGGVDIGGGGGAFSRALVSVTPGESLAAFVDTWSLSTTNTPSATSLSRGATVLVSAASASGTTPGSAGNSIGTVTRSGGLGGQPGVSGYDGIVGAAQAVASHPSSRYPNQYAPTQYFVGGFSGSDYIDLDGLGLGGPGAYRASSALTALVGLGGGGSSDGTTICYPGSGAMIIQFYDGTVPQ